ncbi:MAG TPA: NADH-quinone oxidoreductase subunit NuoF [Acidimicrobiia bacterium]|nr:NADH-quinone oxidoreductase subunit NuoF [Acidimicrobiia bacterium]
MGQKTIITKRLADRPDDSWTIEAVLATNGYDALRAALKMKPDKIRGEVEAAGLRGRGGAGFPTASKWSFLPEGSYPRYLVVNADEGEPSTFKDRMLLERDPHQLVEGIAIASYAVGCNLAFVYVRGEFALGYDRLVAAIDEARGRGYVGGNILGSGFDLEIVVHRGAGAYICGEETALLESLEGRQGMPRIRPPFPAIEGLYAKPTVVNNVETLCTLPAIITMGGAKYGKLGVNRSTGTRLFSLSGHVNRPGNYEVELGTTFRDLMYQKNLGGGIRDDRSVKFFVPGGASSQWLTGSDEHLDAPLDMDFVQETYGVMLGSGAVMVFDDTTCAVRVAWRLAKFFAHESCGKCTPCREGTGWITKILHRIETGDGRAEDLDLLLDVGDNISPGLNAPFSQTTICPLGPSSVSPVVSLDKFFRDEVHQHVTEARCPFAGPRGPAARHQEQGPS